MPGWLTLPLILAACIYGAQAAQQRTTSPGLTPLDNDTSVTAHTTTPTTTATTTPTTRTTTPTTTTTTTPTTTTTTTQTVTTNTLSDSWADRGTSEDHAHSSVADGALTSVTSSAEISPAMHGTGTTPDSATFTTSGSGNWGQGTEALTTSGVGDGRRSGAEQTASTPQSLSSEHTEHAAQWGDTIARDAASGVSQSSSHPVGSVSTQGETGRGQWESLVTSTAAGESSPARDLGSAESASRWTSSASDSLSGVWPSAFGMSSSPTGQIGSVTPGTVTPGTTPETLTQNQGEQITAVSGPDPHTASPPANVTDSHTQGVSNEPLSTPDALNFTGSVNMSTPTSSMNVTGSENMSTPTSSMDVTDSENMSTPTSSMNVTGSENISTPTSSMNFTGIRNMSTTTLSMLLNSSTSFTPHSSPTPVTAALTTALPKNITYEDFVDLRTHNISVCFLEQETLQFHALAGQLLFSQDGHNESRRESCSVQLTAPPDLVLEMSVSIHTNSCLAYTLLVWSSRPYFRRYFGCDSDSAAARLTSPDNVVLLSLDRFLVNASLHLVVNFTAVPPPQLQLIFLTPTTGYVQTPDWDGVTLYPRFVDSWTLLEVPANSSVMVSFLSMDIEPHQHCDYDRLTLLVGGGTADNGTVEVIHCNDNPVLKPTVFHTHLLRFHFQSDYLVEHLGFRLYFSFHPLSQVPQKVPGGGWNCSVPFWPQFQRHLNCNRLEECAGGEDEAQCGYAADQCPRAFFAIGDSCYMLVSGDEHVTWNEAANDCLRRQAYLASLNSPGEWEAVMGVVRDLVTEAVYFGLQTPGPSFPELYHDQFQWADGSAVYYVNVRRSFYSSSLDCSSLRQTQWFPGHYVLFMIECDDNATTSFLCETDTQQGDLSHQPPDAAITLPILRWPGQDDRPHVTCPSGHVTLTFLACDLESACWANRIGLSALTCDLPATPPPPALQCGNGVDHVPYTLVCDHRPDCADNSDENFCVFPSCRRLGKFQCTNKQCVSYDHRCDRTAHCVDGSDERQCPHYFRSSVFTPEPPAIVTFDGHGSYSLQPLEMPANSSNGLLTDPCPETHFLCPGNLTYCMPVFVRCNGVYDCPGREDEVGCDRYQCPGFYRCRASPVCVHASHVCDGAFQCPQHDDELLCGATCPYNCTCQGLAFYCPTPFPAHRYPDLRFLDARDSGLSPQQLSAQVMLVHLNLARCRLKALDRALFPNLRTLDVSDNQLSFINSSQLSGMGNLRQLSLARNPVTFLFTTPSPLQFPSLQSLDLSDVPLSELHVAALLAFPSLLSLNLSGCGVRRVVGQSFSALPFLARLDLRGCPLTRFPADLLAGLKGLQEVWADNYKLCCPETLPGGFHPLNCHSPSDEISSCDALLRSDLYRAVLSLFAALALLGNLGSFLYRVLVNRAAGNLGFGAFVTHLCVSDFLMGVYLALVGVADRLYRGDYLWRDDEWKDSFACKAAGFLSLLSSEVSAFLICLITLDRFLVLRFPFSSLHFHKRSAHAACVAAWVVGMVLAGVPLTADWDFYGQNGICIPLPVTRNDFAGHHYAFAVMIVVNFVLFLLIAAGQVFIFCSIRSNSMAAADSTKKSNDLTIARRLITIAMSDFLCWFPIGLLGLLAACGLAVPGEVNVAMAILALPVNSALNPFLYTLNMLMERRQRAREKRVQQMLMGTFNSWFSETAMERVEDYSKADALDLIRGWLTRRLLTSHALQKVALEGQDKMDTAENHDQ